MFARSLLFAALLACPAQAADVPVTFQIPEGWVDLSPGAPETNFAGFPPPLVKEAKSGKYAAMAFDVAHATPEFATNVNAIVMDGPASLDQESLAAFVKDFSDGSQGKGLKATVTESALREVGGVTWAVVVRQSISGRLKVRQMTWLIPAGKRHAVITYSAADDRFEEYRPVFEKAALATTGSAPAPRMNWSSIALWSLAGAVVAVLIGLARRGK